MCIYQVIKEVLSSVSFFHKIATQHSSVILAQKISKSKQNSRKVEISYINTVEYIFQYSQNSLKSMQILTPFWMERGVNF